MGLSCSKCQVVARSKSKVLQLHFLVYFSPICSKWLSVTLYMYIYICVCVRRRLFGTGSNTLSLMWGPYPV